MQIYANEESMMLYNFAEVLQHLLHKHQVVQYTPYPCKKESGI